MPITREDLEPTDNELVAEQAISGWEDIWRILFHTRKKGKLVPIIAYNKLRINHRQELLDCGVIFYRHEGRTRTLNVSAWPTMARRWITAKSKLGEL